jgi:hypothetical protein
MTNPIPYEQRRDTIVSEILRASGDSDVETTRIVQDATDNAYVEGITDADWLAAMRHWAYELRHQHIVEDILGVRRAGFDDDGTTKAVRDAVTSTYVESITNNDWLAATLRHLGYVEPSKDRPIPAEDLCIFGLCLVGVTVGTLGILTVPYLKQCFKSYRNGGRITG